MNTTQVASIQVFHLVKSDLADRNVYLDVMMGDVGIVKEILRDAPGWDAKGITYVPVASVLTDDMNVAFERTNHIDKSWNLNSGIEMLTEKPVRSTSVGDLFYIGTRVFVVAPFGFEEIVV